MRRAGKGKLGRIRAREAQGASNRLSERVYNIQMIFKENNSIEHFRTRDDSQQTQTHPPLLIIITTRDFPTPLMYSYFCKQAFQRRGVGSVSQWLFSFIIKFEL